MTPPPTLQQTSTVLCHCFRVTQATVEDCVTVMGATSVREVRDICGAGGGCMGCRRRIQAFIEKCRSTEPTS